MRSLRGVATAVVIVIATFAAALILLARLLPSDGTKHILELRGRFGGAAVLAARRDGRSSVRCVALRNDRGEALTTAWIRRPRNSRMCFVPSDGSSRANRIRAAAKVAMTMTTAVATPRSERMHHCPLRATLLSAISYSGGGDRVHAPLESDPAARASILRLFPPVIIGGWDARSPDRCSHGFDALRHWREKRSRRKRCALGVQLQSAPVPFRCDGVP